MRRVPKTEQIGTDLLESGVHCRLGEGMVNMSSVRYVFSIVLLCSFVSVCSVGSAQVYSPWGPLSRTDVVRSPGSAPGASLGVDFLWLRPTGTKLLYMVVDPYRSGSNSIRGSLKGLEHGYAAGFRLFGRSAMNRAAGMSLAYTHFRSTKDTEAQRENEDFWGLLLHANSIIDDNDVTNISAHSTFSLDEGSIGSRVSFAFGSSGRLSFLAGLQYTQLMQDFDILYRQVFDPTTERRVIFTRSNSLSGLGPWFGIETGWHLGGVDIFGEVGAAMLVSSIRGHVKQHDFEVGSINGTLRVDVDCDYGARIVPAASLKLGVGYENDSDYGLFGMRCGYEVRNYFNAVSTYEQYDDVDSQLGANDQSDIGIDGFFIALSATWTFGL